MTRRTILHLIDTGGPGGAETVFSDLVRGLDARDWRSIVTVPEEDWLDEELRSDGIEPILLPTHGSFDAGYLRRILRLIRAHEVDIIQAHLLTAGIYGSVAGLLSSVPAVCTFHGPSDLSPDDGYLGIKLGLLNRPSSRVVFVSEALRTRMVRMWALRRQRTAVIPNGIDGARFRPGRDASLRRELGVEPGEVLVGAVGNVRPPKAYADFLEAAALLRRRSTAYRFVIVGDTRSPSYGQLLQRRSALGLTDAVTFVGFRADVHRVFQNLDVYLLSSRTEGFSLSTVQAMACGVPVVATRCGGPEEIIRDGVTGVLVPPGSPAALADAVHRLSRDPERRARFTRAARAEVERRFTREAMLRAYESLYTHSLRGRASPATAG